METEPQSQAMLPKWRSLFQTQKNWSDELEQLCRDGVRNLITDLPQVDQYLKTYGLLSETGSLNWVLAENRLEKLVIVNMIIEVTHPAMDYNKEDSTFSAELSSIERVRFEITQLCYRAAPIWLRNPKTGVQIKMSRFKVDQDGSGEDTYGWWYHGSHGGKRIKLLLIND